MALTRAQLLMGDGAQGFVLPGQVQGVKEGDGITILPDGTIEVDSQTVRGVMRLGQTHAYADSAYNGYWWPLAVDATDIGKQLTVTAIDGSGYATLLWQDSDGIDWTQRGQIIASTAAGETNDDLVDAGLPRSFLMSATDVAAGGTTGLAYSDAITTAMKVPAGLQTQRPATPAAGETRFNTDQAKLEVWDGLEWQTIASEDPDDGSFVKQIKPTVAGQTDVAQIPAGTTAQRMTAPAPVDGDLRFNTDPNTTMGTQGTMEFWDGANWVTVAAVAAPAGFVKQTAADGAAVIPAGTTATRPTGADLAVGEFRWSTTFNEFEYYIGGGVWSRLGPTQGGVRSFVQNAAPTAVNTGDLWYDTVSQAEYVWDGASWVAPGVTQTGPNASAKIPVGTTVQRGTAYEGAFRLNSTTGKPEMYIGGQWLSISASVTGSFVPQSVPTAGNPSAEIPSGTTAQRQTAPAPSAGFFRYNSTEKQMEYFDGTNWILMGGSTTGEFIDKTVPTAPAGATANAVIPAGSTAQRQTAPAVAEGELRFNTTLDNLEVYINGAWVSIPSSTTGAFVAQTVPTAPAGATANAVIPAGTTAQRQTAPGLTAGQFRYNTTLGQMEFWNGAAWVSVATVSSTNTFGLGLSVGGATGTTVRQAMPVQAAAPVVGTAISQALVGTIWYDSTSQRLRTWNGTNWIGTEPSNWQQVAAAPATRPDGTALQAGDSYYNTVTAQTFVYNGSGWAPIDQRRPRVTAVSLSANANDYVVVTSAGQTITLPASPIAGTCVTVVVAGTFLDTVVARNGQNIMGLAENITLDKQYAAMQFTFTDATNGWRLN